MVVCIAVVVRGQRPWWTVIPAPRAPGAMPGSDEGGGSEGGREGGKERGREGGRERERLT